MHHEPLSSFPSSSGAPLLAIRIDPDNPDHHLWNNHGTWWCHATLHEPGFRKRRLRFSLKTPDVREARRRRDRVFAALAQGPARPARPAAATKEPATRHAA